MGASRPFRINKPASIRPYGIKGSDIVIEIQHIIVSQALIKQKHMIPRRLLRVEVQVIPLLAKFDV